jgi:hypothetical protein
MKQPHGWTAGHLSESDRATRRPIVGYRRGDEPLGSVGWAAVNANVGYVSRMLEAGVALRSLLADRRIVSYSTKWPPWLS